MAARRFKALLITALLLLAGCGQSGPLYLPEEAPPSIPLADTPPAPPPYNDPA